MRGVRGILLGVLVALAVTVPVEAGAATKIVVHGKLQRMKGLTATYRSSHGTFTATWIGKRHYRLAGTIDGRRLRGTFRTRQAASGDSYRASGSGTLGGRSVRITGSGPNTLKSATLTLSSS